MTFGVYVHVPFCTRRCDYCAFATWTDRAHLMDDYAKACIAEVGDVTCPASSVFFGGGTPSLLPAATLTRILDAIPRAEGCEVTVECNPETVTVGLLDTYRAHGVNRLSFGVQSMAPHVLAGLGRTHDPAAVLRAADAARRTGFDNWNADLIYGGFGECHVDWRSTLDAVLALEPAHVSAYALTVEAGTALAHDPSRHPDDDACATRYLVACEVLRDAGFENYEISNWARPGYACRHNLLYWSQGDYRGIGCAAHSHEQGRRWWNVRTPERYIERVTSGQSPAAGEEHLGDEARRIEALTLAVRTRRGVPVDALADIDLLLERGLIDVMGDRVVLTAEGRLLANEVSIRLR
jgi:oxygen-independent coproporphyrinogen-3 oxidase